MDAMEKYADLLIRVGLNLQKGQTLVLASPLECAAFARLLQVKAYQAGAREVVMRWIDEQTDCQRFLMADEAVFDEFPDWSRQFFNGYAEQGAAFLSIAAEDPELLKDVDPKRISRQAKVRSAALGVYRGRLMINKNVWCVASLPVPAWARKVFPELSESQAMAALWQAIFKAVRVDQPDPVKAWQEHQLALDKQVNYLNGRQFKALRYRNSLGTDLTVNLPDHHIWIGGGDKSPAGYMFVANMPTEEVFTLPRADGVNGRVVSSLPLNYNGKLVERFWFEFKDGQVVDYSAARGKETLTELLGTDPGARRLGEVALVPYDSPISNQRILFYNTLFDENASCHFALGKAYPTCLAGGEDLSADQLQAAGVNDSLIHIDFMVGTADLRIVGLAADGRETELFIGGNFNPGLF